MKLLQLSVYVNEEDRHGELPLHEFLVRRLLHLNIHGATVLRGIMGFGKHGRVHRERLLGFADDRPMVVVAIDDEAKIRQILPELNRYVPEGLITLQEIEAPFARP